MRWIALLAFTALLTLAVALLAWLDGNVVFSIVLLWNALSVFWVTGFYAMERSRTSTGPWMHGDRSVWMQLILLPYRVVAFVLAHASRWVRRASWKSDVTPLLVLSARPTERDAHVLQSHGVHAVLDLCAEIPPARSIARGAFAYRSLPVLDRCAPSDADLDEVTSWLATHMREGRRVLVHCAFGRGRSALVAAATLIAAGEVETAEQAEARVVQARPMVRLRREQRAELRAFAARVHARG